MTVEVRTKAQAARVAELTGGSVLRDDQGRTTAEVALDDFDAHREWRPTKWCNLRAACTPGGRDSRRLLACQMSSEPEEVREWPSPLRLPAYLALVGAGWGHRPDPRGVGLVRGCPWSEPSRFADLWHRGVIWHADPKGVSWSDHRVVA